MFDFSVVTETVVQQNALDVKISGRYQRAKDGFGKPPEESPLLLKRDSHISYIHGGLGELPASFVVLDASRPWICYWCLHSLALLEAPLPGDPSWPPSAPSLQDILGFFASCQHPAGGFAGGPGQIPHLAPTYAAVAALVTIGTPEALSVIDREAMASFLKRMAVPKEKGGGFTVHEGGEADVRGCYTALAVAHMLCLDITELGRLSDAAGYVSRCQTYEGGLGGEPGNEAHGGYTFCGVAAAALLGRLDALRLRPLVRFLASCQGTMEGGFMGRTNKLVDGCYSWWQGGVFPILNLMGLEALLAQLPAPSALGGDAAGSVSSYLMHRSRLATGADHTSAGYSGSLAVEPMPPRDRALAAAGKLEAKALQLKQMAQREEKEAANIERSTGVEEIEEEEDAAAHLENSRRATEAAERAHELASQLLSSAVELFPGSEQGASSADSAVTGQGASAPLYNAQALQAWILVNCQVPSGGLRDKPDKHPDYYHTCYCLSGLSAAQNYPGSSCLGGPQNLLAVADPLINVRSDRLAKAISHFLS